MGHRFGKRHGQPSRRQIKLREEEMRRDHERREQQQVTKDRPKANEASQKEESK